MNDPEDTGPHTPHSGVKVTVGRSAQPPAPSTTAPQTTRLVVGVRQSSVPHILDSDKSPQPMAPATGNRLTRAGADGDITAPMALGIALIAWPIALVCIALIFGGTADTMTSRFAWTGIPLLLALAVTPVILVHRKKVAPWVAARRAVPTWGLAVCAAAIFVRWQLLQVLPPPVTGFEELQMGGGALRVVDGAPLPMHFRLTTLMATIGFDVRGIDLAGLRWFFVVAGMASLVVLTALLRRLGLSWPVVAFGVGTMATLRWLVMAGGSADELFAPIAIELVVITAFAAATTSRDHFAVWAAVAGAVAALLCYEYESYRLVALVAPTYWLVRIALDKIGRRRHLISGSIYTACFGLVGAAPINDILRNRSDSLLLDGYLRNNSSLDENGSQAGKFLTATAKALFGGVDDLSPVTYRIPEGSVVPLLVGLLFLIGLIDALLHPRRGFAFSLAVVVVVSAVSASVLTSNFNIGRFTPLVPLLVILAAISLQRAADLLQRRSSMKPRAVGVLIMLLTLVVGTLNARDVQSFTNNEESQHLYRADPYVACEPLGHQEHQFTHLTIHNDGVCVDENDHAWLYPGLRFTRSNEDVFNPAFEPQAGTIVLISKRTGLSDELIEQFTLVAERLGSLASLKTFPTMFDRDGTMTFCYQCAVQPDS